MKIAINMGQDAGDQKASQKNLEREILAAKSGDWNAKANLARVFTPLLTSLAEKRAKDPVLLNKCLEAGKEGLFTAAKKYREGDGVEHFRIFAVDFIEASMDRVIRENQLQGKKGFFSRLFGR